MAKNISYLLLEIRTLVVEKKLNLSRKNTNDFYKSAFIAKNFYY